MCCLDLVYKNNIIYNQTGKLLVLQSRNLLWYLLKYNSEINPFLSLFLFLHMEIINWFQINLTQ